MPDLRTVQEWMHGAITGPDGLPAEPGRMVRGSARLTAEDRIGLYRRSYRARMLDAVRASYPALNHMLGRQAFDEFGLDYLFQHPSRSYTLLRLAQGFPDHLAATRPDDGDAWSELVIDIARLERTFTEVYEGEGIEGEGALAAGELPLEPVPHWRAAKVHPAPCLRLADYSHDVGPYVLAVRRGEQPPAPQRGQSFLAVSRRDYVVRFTALDEAQHCALARLVDGSPLGAAADAAGLAAGPAWELLRLGSGSGFFVTVTNPAGRERATT